jgi:hypothetical protein
VTGQALCDPTQCLTSLSQDMLDVAVFSFLDPSWSRASVGEGAGLALIELSVDASSSKATQTSSTRPPAQTANCSGVATNRWWHASEQK